MPAAGTRSGAPDEPARRLRPRALLAARRPRCAPARPHHGPPLQDGTVADQSLNLRRRLERAADADRAPGHPRPRHPASCRSPRTAAPTTRTSAWSRPAAAGTSTIAVFGYNGASSPQPYTLRVTTQAPPTHQLPAAHVHRAAPAGTLPAPRSLPTNLNTLILVNEKRIGDTYGAAAETNVVAALTSLAGDAHARRQRRRAPGREHPRRPASTTRGTRTRATSNAANAVANAIANEVATIKAARPSAQVRRLRRRRRPDPVLPHPRPVADRERERLRRPVRAATSTTARSRAATCSPTTRTSTRDPVPASGRQLFIPEPRRRPARRDGAATSRTPSRASRTLDGTLDSSTAFVSGYDFVTDGSQQRRQRLQSNLGATR